MTAPQWLSLAVVLASLVALIVQVRHVRHHPVLRRVVMIVGLAYFAVIYSLAALPANSTDYLIRSGILTRLGVLFLLVTLTLDKGDC